jgi:hypothetical protein
MTPEETILSEVLQPSPKGKFLPPTRIPCAHYTHLGDPCSFRATSQAEGQPACLHHVRRPRPKPARWVGAYEYRMLTGMPLDEIYQRMHDRTMVEPFRFRSRRWEIFVEIKKP